MARKTCEDFASCIQHQRYTNEFLRQGDGPVYEKFWCSKCGRQWYHVYILYMIMDVNTGEVIGRSDVTKFDQDVEQMLKDLKTGDPEKLEIPY